MISKPTKTSRYYLYAFSLDSIRASKKRKFFLLKKKSRRVKFYNVKSKFRLYIQRMKRRSFVKLEKEDTSKINNRLDFFFKNRKAIKGCSNRALTFGSMFLQEKSRMILMPTLYSIRKNRILFGFGRRKQSLYALLDSILALREDFILLLSRELLNEYSAILGAEREFFFVSLLSSFLNWNCFNFSLKSKAIFSKFFIGSHTTLLISLLRTSLYVTSLHTEEQQYKPIPYVGYLELSCVQRKMGKLAHSTFFSSKVNYNTVLRQYQVASMFSGRNSTLIGVKSNNYFLTFIKQNLLKNCLNISNYVWKRSFVSKKNFFLFTKTRAYGWKGNHNWYKRELSRGVVYMLTQLHEKSKLLLLGEQDTEVQRQQLLALRDLLLFEIDQKIRRATSRSLILTTLDRIKTLRKQRRSRKKKEQHLLFWKALASKMEELNLVPSENLCGSLNLRKKRSRARSQNIAGYRVSKTNLRKLVSKRALWKDKKLGLKEAALQFNQTDKFFSLLFKNSTSLFFINALSLTKFAFVYPEKKRNVNKFLSRVEREMISRYKYVAVYIQDLVRVSFLSLFLKKPAFLASFIGFQIAKLPKNRKETKLTKFIIKVVKVFSSQREETIGMKIEFKGRVNRWRRTKIIRGISGLLPLYDYHSRIEFGSSKAITRKGALGIRLWFCYRSSFGETFRDSLYNYIQYSQRLRARSVKRFLNRFSSFKGFRGGNKLGEKAAHSKETFSSSFKKMNSAPVFSKLNSGLFLDSKIKLFPVKGKSKTQSRGETL